jgi:hypothetical protein
VLLSQSLLQTRLPGGRVVPFQRTALGARWLGWACGAKHELDVLVDGALYSEQGSAAGQFIT